MAEDLLLFPLTMSASNWLEVKSMKCRHVACSCEAEAGRQYCSNECESDTRDEGATDCHCGHDDCRASHSSHRDST
jgi:hypothetical protein